MQVTTFNRSLPRSREVVHGNALWQSLRMASVRSECVPMTKSSRGTLTFTWVLLVLLSSSLPQRAGTDLKSLCASLPSTPPTRCAIHKLDRRGLLYVLTDPVPAVQRVCGADAGLLAAERTCCRFPCASGCRPTAAVWKGWQQSALLSLSLGKSVHRTKGAGRCPRPWHRTASTRSSVKRWVPVHAKIPVSPRSPVPHCTSAPQVQSTNLQNNNIGS
jgi:hypothetical protein